MKHINLLLGVTLAVGVVLGSLGSQMLSAQDNLKSGTVLQRTELKAAPGWEAILVQRILPPGAESGSNVNWTIRRALIPAYGRHPHARIPEWPGRCGARAFRR